MIENLPLTQTIIETNLNHLYPYLTSIAVMGDREITNIDEYGVSCQWFLDEKKLTDARKQSGLSAKSFNRFAAEKFIDVSDEFVALMPLKCWQDFMDFLRQNGERSWNSYAKLFCYMYFNCAKHEGCSFSHSREQFQVALGMQGADISKKIEDLAAAGFFQKTTYNADQGIARSYILKREYWPDYRDYQIKKLNSKKYWRRRKSIV